MALVLPVGEVAFNSHQIWTELGIRIHLEAGPLEPLQSLPLRGRQCIG